MQIESRIISLLNYFAEMQLILSKDNVFLGNIIFLLRNIWEFRLPN